MVEELLHNTCASEDLTLHGREAVVVTKRLLIRGAGGMGDARLDQRANSPALRLERACMVEGLDIDMTGFKEAVHVAGGAAVAPLIQRCILRCGAAHTLGVCTAQHVCMSLV